MKAWIDVSRVSIFRLGWRPIFGDGLLEDVYRVECPTPSGSPLSPYRANGEVRARSLEA
nr:hypothetical protein [Candidatus Njordarchaeum guaymaensis]